MPFRVHVITAVAALALAIAPAAASAHWHPPYDNGSAPQYSVGDPGLNGGAGSSDPSATGGTPNWVSSDTGSQDAGPRPGSTPAPGDPQQTPNVWNHTPPAQQPDGTPANPWSNAPALPVSKTPTIAGRTAMIRRNGLAAVPKGAPARVRAIIAAANTIIGKPYKWGGGHGRLFDSGYDCSGSVSYALIRARLLGSPMTSGTLAHWGARGAGRYVTIYANAGHVYMEVAGLRLDTSSVGDPGGKSGVRWRAPIGKRFGFAVRHIAGL